MEPRLFVLFGALAAVLGSSSGCAEGSIGGLDNQGGALDDFGSTRTGVHFGDGGVAEPSEPRFAEPSDEPGNGDVPVAPPAALPVGSPPPPTPGAPPLAPPPPSTPVAPPPSPPAAPPPPPPPPPPRAPNDQPPCGPEVYVDPVQGNDSGAGTASQPWRTLFRAQDYAESQRGSAQETCIYLAPGSYGPFIWDPGSFNEGVTWRAMDHNNPPKFEQIEVICGSACAAAQVFDGIEVHLPSGSSPEATVNILNVTNLEIKNSEVHNEDLYASVNGIKIAGSSYVTVRNTAIHDVVHAVRYNGDSHLFDGNHVYRFAGSGFTMLCGGIGGRAQSSRFTTISNNHIHDHAGDYPSEPGYSGFDEPDELHASVISIRGSDLTVHGNWIYDIQESVNLQFYLGDCGVSNYQIQNITITNNVMYNVSHGPLLQSSASPVGPIVVRNNTVLDGFLNVDLSKPSGLGYNGAGTIVNDNLVLNGLGCASNQNGDSHLNPNSDWVCESNVYNSLVFTISQAHPSNTEVGNDRSFFRNAMANPQSETGACQPLGSALCDLRLDPGHPFCTGGANGGYIGAIPCSGNP